MTALTKSMAEQLRQEHAAISSVLTQMKGLVQHSESAQKDRAVWQQRVEASLSSLYDHLRHHFAFEESGGFMTEVVNVLPNLDATVNRLKDEHRSILAETEQLCGSIRQDALIAEKLVDFTLAVLLLIHRLERHEHAENALVQHAFADDLGAAD